MCECIYSHLLRLSWYCFLISLDVAPRCTAIGLDIRHTYTHTYIYLYIVPHHGSICIDSHLFRHFVVLLLDFLRRCPSVHGQHFVVVYLRLAFHRTLQRFDLVVELRHTKEHKVIYLSIYLSISIYMYLYVSICIYTYIYRERET